MLFKNFLEILSNYKFNLIKIIFYEFLYILRGYKGNKFISSKNDRMTHNFPCPYFFLIKIEKALKQENFNIFMDLGCGSGRVINFFNKKFLNKKYIGVEYFTEYSNYCKNVFKKNNNIEIIQSDFTKINLEHFKVDCLFFNSPMSNERESLNFLKLSPNCSLIFVLKSLITSSNASIKLFELSSTIFSAKFWNDLLILLNPSVFSVLKSFN